MLKTILRSIPHFFNSKDMFIYIVAVLVLILGVLTGFGKLGFSYRNAMDVQERVTLMESSVEEWKLRAKQLKQEPYHPVTTSQIDDIQSNILLLMAANGLTMNSFRAVQGSDSKNTTGNLYEMEIEGPWSSTVRVLADFHVKNALMAINTVKLAPVKDGGVKTALQYKIYTDGPQKAQGK